VRDDWPKQANHPAPLVLQGPDSTYLITRDIQPLEKRLMTVRIPGFKLPVPIDHRRFIKADLFKQQDPFVFIHHFITHFASPDLINFNRRLITVKTDSEV